MQQKLPVLSQSVIDGNTVKHMGKNRLEINFGNNLKIELLDSLTDTFSIFEYEFTQNTLLLPSFCFYFELTSIPE